jgi:ribosome-binding factor A
MELMAGTNPRAVRIAALIQRVIASSVERHLHDSRLNGNVTITEVRVTNDLADRQRVLDAYLVTEGHEEGERKRAQQALTPGERKVAHACRIERPV